VVKPIVKTWIEEPGQGTGRRGNRSDVASLVPVAGEASISQVVGNGQTAMLFANDVIDFATEESIVLVDKAYSQRRSALRTTSRRNSTGM
jgi:hypothetical protein